MSDSTNTVITIARQFGSGGREIGMRLAALLGIKSYDKELITMAAQKSGMSSEILHHADEKATNSLLYTLALGSSYYGAASVDMNVPINDKLFITQSEIIRELAAESPCIIIGRCSDYVLRSNPNRFSIFIYAPLEEKIKRVIESGQAKNEKEARELISRSYKRRINYYNYYTGRKWGSPDNYNMLIDSSFLGIEGTARALADIYREKQK